VEIARRIDVLIPLLSVLEKSFTRGRILHDGLTLAIVGRPNAGKSSIFNRLAERERAIVTATPGTTRDLVTERIAIDGIPIELVDTAGVRETLEEVERLGIARTHEALADAALVLIVLDATEELNEDERKLLTAIEGRAAIVVKNKCDLGKKAPQIQSKLEIVQTSALTGDGLPELREAISKLAIGGAAAEPGALTTMRHHQAVEESIAALKKAAESNAARIPHEMLLLDLYAALGALDALTGQTTNDDILNLIFSSFCIGK
jgi:tRNA modification GTPase